MEIVIGIIILVAFVWDHERRKLRGHQPRRTHPGLTAAPAGGWIYFACAGTGPVKVGTSPTLPTGSQVIDSAEPVRVVYRKQVRDVEGDVRKIVKDLAPYHVRRSWFDRDATLFYVDHLKGAV